MDYDFRSIENKWQKFWAENKTFKVAEDLSKPKFYVLDMFPYPSGAGLHVGHPLGYIASDIYSRYKRLQGFNVLHPMGYDSFGLPAEQYAIQTGQHPAITTEQNIARYRDQMDKIGFSFDWDREVRTSSPAYYKWTQWIFIQLFNSWYNPKTNKAEDIQTLVEIFEKQGSQGVNLDMLTGDIEKDVIPFTADEWKNYNENKKLEILMNFRLAYLGESYVNWCAALGTVLANDEVVNGVSERGGHPVERKLMKQWSMRITAYSQRLLNGLNEIDWSESIKETQRNWIGRSEGASIFFPLWMGVKEEDISASIEVFTTRPDTVFGVSFVTLAPEHDLVAKITIPEQKTQVEAYVEKAKNRSERERQADVNTISGVFTGSYVEHPFTKEPIPIWVGDYVLVGYGTGAVMAVPAHDERDYKFAKHFDIPIKQVISPTNEAHDMEKAAWTEKEGVLIKSDFLNGLAVKQAISRAIEEIAKNGFGKGRVNYRLRDAVFGRQRYWGEPIPIYYQDETPFGLKESELPLNLPEVDKYLPTEDGEPPLARANNWKYDKEYEYELSTMPGWAGSSWYFLRYLDPKNDSEFVGKDKVDYWQNVDLYIGGSEHATGHLLYARFWTKFLFDRGYIPFDEPFKKMINQGMILGRSSFVYLIIGENKFVSHSLKDNYVCAPIHVDISLVDNDKLDIEAFRNWRPDFADAEFIYDEDGTYVCGYEVEKMSKSKYNVQTPDELVEKFGADTLRMYEMFLGPLEQTKPWDTKGINGVYNFLRKLWRLFHDAEGNVVLSETEPSKESLKTLHKTIKKMKDDLDRFSFNTGVSNFMICVNELTDQKCNNMVILSDLIIMLSPYAPHISEELWVRLGNTPGTISLAKFPTFNEAFLVESAYDYPVSFNGKMRFKVNLSLSMNPKEIEEHVLTLDESQKWLEGKVPKKVIIVQGKIVNVVM
ncbi:MAG: leucine--tRNA ligase [Bacteroidetes bacterium]|nr:leucine--tRNA ligase [Bacteroidota bacterium]